MTTQTNDLLAEAKELLKEIAENIELGECGDYSTCGDWYVEAMGLIHRMENNHAN